MKKKYLIPQAEVEAVAFCDIIRTSGTKLDDGEWGAEDHLL